MTPSPAYHVYYGAGLSAGAETIPYGLYRENNFAPDWDSAFPRQQLERLAIFYLVRTEQPDWFHPLEGGSAKGDQDGTGSMISSLAVDECYSELFYDEAPTGKPGSSRRTRRPFQECDLLQLSYPKRSGAAGLTGRLCCRRC